MPWADHIFSKDVSTPVKGFRGQREFPVEILALSPIGEQASAQIDVEAVPDHGPKPLKICSFSA